MTKPRPAFWLAFVATLLVPLAGFAQKKPKIIVVTHGQASDPFWLVVRNGVETAAKETGSDVEYQATERFDLPAMSKLVDAAVASKPDGLVVSIPDAVFLSKSIQAAVAAKIPVISINSGLDVSKKLGCLMHIGQEEESAGREAGQRLANYVKYGSILQNDLILTEPSFVTPENVAQVANASAKGSH